MPYRYKMDNISTVYTSILYHDYTQNQNVNEEGYFIPLENANTFINVIADKYDNSFKDIKVYGSNKYPLFRSSNIRDILVINRRTFENNIRNYKENYEIVRNCKAQLVDVRDGKPHINNRSDVSMLTKFGLYNALSISNTEIAYKFKEFVHIVLHTLETEGEVKLNDALEKLELENKKQKLRIEEQKIKIDYQKDVINFKDNQNANLHEYKAIAYDKEGLNGTKEKNIIIGYFQENYMTRTPLWIVNPNYMIEKYIDQEKKSSDNKNESKEEKEQKKIKKVRNDSAVEGLRYEGYQIIFNKNKVDFDVTNLMRDNNLPEYQDDKDWNDYNVTDIQNIPYDLYFNIQTFKSNTIKNSNNYHKLQDIFILDENHYDTIMARITKEDDFKTPVKKVFKIDYDSIKDIVETTLAERLQELKAERLQIA